MFLLMMTLLVHPVHLTNSEVQWNGDTRRFEVSVRMQAEDVQRAFDQVSAKPVLLDRLSKEEFQRLAVAYMEKHFRVEDSKKSKGALHWVGTEDERARIWFYFELSPPEGVSGTKELVLINTLLLEFETDQVNTVRFLTEPPLSVNFDRKRTAIILVDGQPKVGSDQVK